MRILMINKFLYPNGGSETYIFKLGDYLKSQGHEVQYFGMEHEGRCAGNTVNAYTSDMDFHGGSKLAKLTYPLKTIYSSEARKKLRLVLDDFKPQILHINNPVVMNDFENNNEYMEKIEYDLRTLYEFRNELNGYSRILELCQKIHQISPLCFLVRAWHCLAGKLERSLLTKVYPNTNILKLMAKNLIVKSLKFVLISLFA